MYIFGFSLSLYCIIYFHAPELILIGLPLVFQTDHGALVIGSNLGKTYFTNNNSIDLTFFKHKSVEGLLGGIAFSVLTAVLMKFEAEYIQIINFPNWISFSEYIILGLAISFFGLLGDLFESFLKRIANVKDSGTLLPGHGGLFDRLDSILAVSPVLFTFMVWQNLN